MPALEALLDRFHAAHTQPLGMSVDSIHCHANWGASLGGISFPLLSDFHPKGAVARSLGAYLDEVGITDRATVILDASGIVRYAASVGPSGQRDIAALAQVCEEIDAGYEGPREPIVRGSDLPSPCELFIKSNCGFSRAAMLARANLHLDERVPVRNVSEDAAARQALQERAGASQAPCLVLGDEAVLESQVIIDRLRKARVGW